MYGKHITARNRKIVQLNKDGTFVKEWVSISEAQKAFSTRVNISGVCRGERSHAKGFIWEYAEDYYGIKPERKTRKKKI